MRDQFTFYRSFWEAIKGLKKKDDRLAALEAICAYALDGEERRNTDVSGSIFTLVKPVLDAAERKSSGGKNKGSKAEDTDKIPSSKAEDAAYKKEGEIEVEGEIEKEIENECSIKEKNKEKPIEFSVLKAARLPENQRYYEGRR